LEQLFAGIPIAYRTYQIDPAVLGACQPSKTVGIRHYELSFGTKFEGYDDGFGHGPGAKIIIQTPSLMDRLLTRASEFSTAALKYLSS
jgi:hypothetical protein